MKKTLLAGLVIGVFMIGMVGNTMADTISYYELYSPDILMVKGGVNEINSWTFDITDNAGWGTPGQTFSNGAITLTLEDDGGKGDGAEKATFAFDGGTTGPINADINAAVWRGAFTVDYSQFNDGLISAKLTVTDGDFYFQKAELKVTSTFTPSPVPEPTTMLLLGTGLIGLVVARRRKAKKD